MPDLPDQASDPETRPVEEIENADQTSEGTNTTSHSTPIETNIPTDVSSQIVSSEPKSGRHFPRIEKMLPAFLRIKLGRFARPFVLVVLLLILSGGGFGYWHLTSAHKKAQTGVIRFAAVTEPFRVVSTVPADNASGVQPTTSITFNFSQPVNAQKLLGNLFLTPNVDGTYAQGSSSKQVVFTPKVPFKEGTKVQLMLNATFQSQQGAQLGAAYLGGFTTLLPSNGVIFEDANSLYSLVNSLKSGTKEPYTLVFGQDVPTKLKVTLYKSSMNGLLQSLIYKNVTTNDYTYPDFSSHSIDTTGMQSIDTKTDVTDKSAYAVTQQEGVYVAVVTDGSNNQYGHVWLDYSDIGVIARADDQKVVVATQDLSTNTDTSTNVTLYNLKNSVTALSKSSVTGFSAIPASYSPSVDVAVASDGSSDALVPLNILESQGDIRVDQDLAKAVSVYGVTDKPTYGTSDTVRYAGFARQNQDALYKGAPNTLLHLYIAQYAGGTPLASFTAQTDADGYFNGSFTIQPSWLSSLNVSNSNFEIYVASTGGSTNNTDVALSNFTVTSAANATTNISVAFAKSNYVPTDTVQAVISAKNATGTPLANTKVDVHLFTQNYYDNDATANSYLFGINGNEIDGTKTTLQTDANGQATYTVPLAKLPNDGSSQHINVQVNLTSATSGAAGGASTIIHQGNGILSFGSNTNAITSGGTLKSRVYATSLSGAPLANQKLSFFITSTANSNVITSGTATTDQNGYVEISAATNTSGLTSNDGLVLNVSMSDNQQNKIQAKTYYYLSSVNSIYDTSGAGLQDLDVSGAPTNLKVGQSVNLVINAPTALNALVTMDRGRIYNAHMMKLNQGSNNYSFTVTSDMAPSFTLTFSYFKDGLYKSEGVQYQVTNDTKVATVTLTPTSSTVTAGTSTTVQIHVKNSVGANVQTNLIAQVVSLDAYQLNADVTPDMYTSLYKVLPIMTSSSSSLSNIGSGGGGRCGGGDGSFSNFTNPIGTTLLWQPKLSTDNNGNVNLSFTPTKGKWLVNVFAADASTMVGSSTTVITAN